MSQGSETLREAALFYHEHPKPGKLEVRATKPLANGRDLARAYSPGVAEASLEIARDPSTASRYTARGNLVAVVSNGTAVLGLGDIGALASKPVMEGKAVLFKKFANIDCFDIEVAETDPEKLAEIVCALEPTFGAINLEDIKAPDCFVVEKICRERMNIPVFHDDQHGTAIVVGRRGDERAARHRTAFSRTSRWCPPGAAPRASPASTCCSSSACAARTVWLCDSCRARARGARGTDDAAEGRLSRKARRRPRSKKGDRGRRSLPSAFRGRGVLTPGMVARMAEKPVIFALANPTPEILPELARAVAPEAVIRDRSLRISPTRSTTCCASRSSSAARSMSARRRSTTPCRSPASRGIAALARATTSAEAAAAYHGERLSFGADYLIPKPFDPRLDGGGRLGGGPRRDGKRRRHPADRGSRCLQAATRRFGVPFGADHAPGLRGRGNRLAPHRLCRGRGTSGCSGPHRR